MFGTAAGAGLCLPRLFSAGRRSPNASAGGVSRPWGFCGGLLALSGGERALLTICRVSRKAQERSFSGCPATPTFSEVGASLKNAYKGPVV